MTRTHTERDLNVHTARVYLREAQARRQYRGWHATLLGWAANARRRADAATPRDLFGMVG